MGRGRSTDRGRRQERDRRARSVVAPEQSSEQPARIELTISCIPITPHDVPDKHGSLRGLPLFILAGTISVDADLVTRFAAVVLVAER